MQWPELKTHIRLQPSPRPKPLTKSKFGLFAIIPGRRCDEKLEALGQCIPPPRHVLPVSRSGPGSLPKFNHLFTGLLPTFRENFRQIRSEVFGQSCYLTNKQTNNDDYIYSLSLAEVISRRSTLLVVSYGVPPRLLSVSRLTTPQTSCHS